MFIQVPVLLTWNELYGTLKASAGIPDLPTWSSQLDLATDGRSIKQCSCYAPHLAIHSFVLLPYLIKLLKK